MKYSIILCLIVLASCQLYKPPIARQIESEKSYKWNKKELMDLTARYLYKFKMIGFNTSYDIGTIYYSGDVMEYQNLLKDAWNGDRLIKPLCDCGLHGINNIPYQTKVGEINFLFTEYSGNTSVRVDVKQSYPIGSDPDFKCVSTGLFEKDYFKYIDSCLNLTK